MNDKPFGSEYGPGGRQRTCIEISVVIPVYNSGLHLNANVQKLLETLRDLANTYEVILVDDSSTDGQTSDLARSLSEKYRDVHACCLLTNSGQVQATLTGMKLARGTFVSTMDDDLAIDPKYLRAALAQLVEEPGVDCVQGVVPTSTYKSLRRIRARSVYFLLKHWSLHVPQGTQISSFRVFRAGIARQLSEVTSDLPYMQLKMAALGIRYSTLTVVPRNRGYAATRYGSHQLIRESWRILRFLLSQRNMH